MWSDRTAWSREVPRATEAPPILDLCEATPWCRWPSRLRSASGRTLIRVMPAPAREATSPRRANRASYRTPMFGTSFSSKLMGRGHGVNPSPCAQRRAGARLRTPRIQDPRRSGRADVAIRIERACHRRLPGRSHRSHLASAMTPAQPSEHRRSVSCEPHVNPGRDMVRGRGPPVRPDPRRRHVTPCGPELAPDATARSPPRALRRSRRTRQRTTPTPWPRSVLRARQCRRRPCRSRSTTRRW